MDFFEKRKKILNDLNKRSQLNLFNFHLKRSRHGNQKCDNGSYMSQWNCKANNYSVMPVADGQITHDFSNEFIQQA